MTRNELWTLLLIFTKNKCTRCAVRVVLLHDHEFIILIYWTPLCLISIRE